MSGAGKLRMTLGQHQAGVDAALAEMDSNDIMSRIWAHDHTVWKPEPTEISNRLGWLTIAGRMREALAEINGLVEAVRADRYRHVVLLGMGGSSLAPDVFQKTFGAGDGFLTLAVLDSTDPAAVLATAEGLDLAKTLFIVATKSGGTVETLSFFKFFYNRVAALVGADAAGARFVAITDGGSKLEALASRLNFRHIFLNDPNIGGRFSALSFFGLVPAALLGVDVDLLLDRALEAASICGGDVPADQNPAAQLGALMGELAKVGRDKLTLLASQEIASFSDWVEQLIAESTGKEGMGILPVVGETPGAVENYGDDRLFVTLALGDDVTYTLLPDALEKAGHPVVRFVLGDVYDLGQQFFLWELATAVAGERLGINPFDQPNVEAAKVLARQSVEAYHTTGALPELTSALVDGGIAVYGDVAGRTARDALRQFLAQAEPGAYVVIQAYLQPTKAHTGRLQALRTALRDQTGLAVTSGYGPRFLHSTGQLHKGDAGRGLFIQLTAPPVQDAAIPDEAGSNASAMTFGVLIAAQAAGDRQALLDAGRRVVRFELRDGIMAGLDALIQSLS